MFDPKIACQTLPYSELPFERAVEGIARAGYKYFAFGVSHQKVETPAPEDSDEKTLEYARMVTDAGMAPVMMFRPRAELGTPDSVDPFKRRLDQAALIGVQCVLAWGPWGYKKWPDEPYPPEEWEKLIAPWFEDMRPAAAHAESVGVTIVLKPHTGLTATAAVCRQTIERIGSPAVAVCYDGGNVHFYEGVDPVEDIKLCADITKAICAKDHVGERANPLFPCIGDGDVSHEGMLRVLKPFGFDGPVAVERFEGPYKKSEMTPEQMDELARQAREHLEAAVARVKAEG